MTSPVFWVFNAGSSSIKFSVFSAEDTMESPVSVWVIPTDEESMIARHMRTLWKDRPS